jgi:hypothetical protein
MANHRGTASPEDAAKKVYEVSNLYRPQETIHEDDAELLSNMTKSRHQTVDNEDSLKFSHLSNNQA